MEKSADAFRTISEVAELLDTPAHVLRFWESRFPQIKPVKRAGGRRYYRPNDVALLQGIKRLLHDEGMTIRGVQKILREQGVRHVSGLSDEVTPEEAALEEAMLARLDTEDDEAPLPTEEIEAVQAEALEAAIERAAMEQVGRPALSGPAVVMPFPGTMAAEPVKAREPEVAAVLEPVPEAPMAEDVDPLHETAQVDHIFASAPDRVPEPIAAPEDIDLPWAATAEAGLGNEVVDEAAPAEDPIVEMPPPAMFDAVAEIDMVEPVAAAVETPVAPAPTVDLPPESTGLAVDASAEPVPIANRLRALPPGTRMADPAHSRALLRRLVALRNSMAGYGQASQN